MKLQNWEFRLLAFSLAFGPGFSHSAPFPLFWDVEYSLCHCMLEVPDLPFEFGIAGVQLRDCLESRQRLWILDFKQG